VVVLLSPDSKKSPWVRREISYAEDNGKRIFPVLVAGDERTAIPIRLTSHQRIDIRQNVEVGLKSLWAALSFYLEDLATREQMIRKEAEKLAREKVERKALDKVIRKKAVYNFLRAFVIIIIGAILYGGGELLGYSYTKHTQYTFVAWLPPILGILFGPVVGGVTVLAGDLMYQVFLPFKSTHLYFFINQLNISSHLLSVVFAGLIVKDTRNWKKIIFAGLIILSIPQLIGIWSEFSLQFFYKEENWEWLNSLKNMLLNVWILRTLMPNL